MLDLINAEYTGLSFTPGAPVINLLSEEWRPDGLKMWVVDLNVVRQYSAALPFSYAPGNLTFDGSTHVAPGIPDQINILGFRFIPPGNRFFVLGTKAAGFTIDEWTLGTNYDLAGVQTLTAGTFNASSVDFNPSSFRFSDALFHFFVSGTNPTDRLHELDMALPGTFLPGGNVTDPGKSFLFANEDNRPISFTFYNGGKNILMVGTQNNRVYQYDLILPFDTAALNIMYSGKFFDLSAQIPGGNPTTINVDSTETKMFVGSNSPDTLFQYDVSDKTGLPPFGKPLENVFERPFEKVFD